MPEIQWTESFRVFYLDLPAEIRKKVHKAIRLLDEDPRRPSIRSNPIKGAPGIYEARVDLGYRMTYERLPGNILRLRVVGKHDDALKGP